MRISINGQFVPDIRLQGDELEFNFAYGVFETIRTYGGKPFELAAHLQRLRRSAENISLQVAPTNDQLSAWVQQHGSGSQELRLKIIAAVDRIYILSQPLILPDTLWTKGVTIGLYTLRRNQPAVKSLARIQEYLAHAQAVQRKQYDALLINERKEVYECAQANFYYVKDDVIYTPRHFILPGITRAIVLPLAEQHYTVKQKRLHLDEVLLADECFITQTSAGIVPVVRIEERRVKSGKPGMVTKHLMELFEEYVARA